ncbi:hypothetical protein TPHA_0B04090 [Tetrapisispora phaffii CBS 4417]|uniref:Endonuclease n=1 Tax=Tetrapisispora phaffii (strain ATCC 24235 / CBS 4417 / NBRC 1672 / NRRL Y-8282 / UCD 70-5) TaxID=1071381 RepID=G8BPZ9_TETPH|nr:hypothetical protein TPHA_0B04090 [Tetrapisispora phaffii CBS 4417]CCE62080.1 hypothetical protein TPHA_0B04090 [Tetrapisispora phaffii CBS 4417]
MSYKNIFTGLAGIGLGGSAATYFFGNTKASTTTQVGNVPAVSTGKGKPSGTFSAVGSDLNPAGFYKYGFPAPIHDLDTKEQYISCYNRQTRNPYWVIEHITPDSLSKRNSDRKYSVFTENELIPEMFRAKLSDYFRSGYDRGHQVPAADAKYSQNVMNDTFVLTNICPQVGEGFNRDYWAHFEYFCRSLTKEYSSVRIMTGPLYLPKKDPIDGKFKISYEVIGNPPAVAVPTHFFKLIVAETPMKNPKSSSVSVAAFVLPNDKIPNETKLTDFEVPVNALERSTGLELLKLLPENRRKKLCEEVNCQIVVREFNNANNNSKAPLALPPPKTN